MSELADAAGEIARMLAGLNEMLSPIMEASAGHRELAKTNGFDDASSSRMGADYHGVMMELVKTKMFGGQR